MTAHKITLIGMPSAGKTTIGKELALRLGYKQIPLEEK
jgi:shikimate kinase